MTYEGVVSAARSRASSISSLEKPSPCRYPMTWVSPSARTLPGPLAMAMLRDAHNASRFGLGLLVFRGLWAWSLRRPAASAATLPPHVRLYRRLAPSSLRVVRDGSAGPGLQPTPASCWTPGPCRSTAPTLQFLYYAAVSIRNICARPGQRRGDCAADLGEPGLPGASRRAVGRPGAVHLAGAAAARSRPHDPGRAAFLAPALTPQPDPTRRKRRAPAARHQLSLSPGPGIGRKHI